MTHPHWPVSRVNESTTSDAQPHDSQVQDSAWNTMTHTLEGAGLVEDYSASGAARWNPEILWKPTPYSPCQTGTGTRRQQPLYVLCRWLWFCIWWEQHQDVLRSTIREKSPGMPRTPNRNKRVPCVHTLQLDSSFAVELLPLTFQGRDVFGQNDDSALITEADGLERNRLVWTCCV
jgi:hypothetical protein